MSRRLNIVYVWVVLVFSLMESSVLIIMYIFSFFLVFKLYKCSLQIIIHIIPDHFWAVLILEVIGYYLVGSDMYWKGSFNSCSFLRCFFLTCKSFMSGLYTIPYFGYGKCFIWESLVLAFINSASLSTIYFL